MAVTFVQGTGAQRTGSGASQALAFTSNVVAGNRLVVCTSTWQGDAGTGSVTDSQGNTYTRRVTASTSGFITSAIYTAVAGSSGACTVTFTPASGTWMSIGLAEVAITTPSIGASAGAGGNSAAPASGNVTAGDAAIFFGGMRNSLGNTITPGTGWTLIAKGELISNQVPFGFSYRIEPSATTKNANWTTGGGVWTAVALAIEDTGGGGGGILPVFDHHYREMGIM